MGASVKAKLWDQIKNRSQCFTIATVAKKVKCSENTAGVHLKRLCDNGYLTRQGEGYPIKYFVQANRTIHKAARDMKQFVPGRNAVSFLSDIADGVVPPATTTTTADITQITLLKSIDRTLKELLVEWRK